MIIYAQHDFAINFPLMEIIYAYLIDIQIMSIFKCVRHYIKNLYASSFTNIQDFHLKVMFISMRWYGTLEE